MSVLKMLFLVAALVLLLFAAWPPINERAPIHPGWFGLAFFVATWLVP